MVAITYELVTHVHKEIMANKKTLLRAIKLLRNKNVIVA